MLRKGITQYTRMVLLCLQQLKKKSKVVSSRTVRSRWISRLFRTMNASSSFCLLSLSDSGITAMRCATIVAHLFYVHQENNIYETTRV